MILLIDIFPSSASAAPIAPSRPTTESTERGVGFVRTTEGVIEGKPYSLQVGFDDVLIGGSGWGGLYHGHAPSELAKIETCAKTNPLNDKTFFSEVMKVAMEAEDGVQGAIAQDWGPGSMHPDNDGSVKHPLFGGVSAVSFCMHGDMRSTGAQMVANMWHCPKCSAIPARYASDGVVERNFYI
jgi:hypothetical protein